MGVDAWRRRFASQLLQKGISVFNEANGRFGSKLLQLYQSEERRGHHQADEEAQAGEGEEVSTLIAIGMIVLLGPMLWEQFYIIFRKTPDKVERRGEK